MEPLDEVARTHIETAIYGGRKVEAIKLYREAAEGAGLAEAKQAIDALETRLRAEHPENFRPAASKTGCLGMVLVVAVGMAGSLSFLTVLAFVGK